MEDDDADKNTVGTDRSGRFETLKSMVASENTTVLSLSITVYNTRFKH